MENSDINSFSDNPAISNLDEKHCEQKRSNQEKCFDVVIIGGLGHVGLPLGLTFANVGLDVCLYDIDAKKAELVKQGVVPFIEYGAEPILKKVLENKTLTVSINLNDISNAEYVIFVLGTPVDEYGNPKTKEFLETIAGIKPYLNINQTIIIRSTVYPNTCKQVLTVLKTHVMGEWLVAYCPERIAQGYAIKELKEIPQIVAGLSEQALIKASDLFSKISPKIIQVAVEEAELIKLFSNALRYIQFATANEFYTIAKDAGIDYEKLRKAMCDGYKRAEMLPTAGFTAGPCLIKDTKQLLAYSSNHFLLGNAAIMINEGLPKFVVEDLKKKCDLSKTSVGILGSAFKADVDDTRDSLAFKLGKILTSEGAAVYYSDEYAINKDLIRKEDMIKLSDVIIVAAPHSSYKNIKIPKDKEVIDLWGIIK